MCVGVGVKHYKHINQQSACIGHSEGNQDHIEDFSNLLRKTEF